MSGAVHVWCDGGAEPNPGAGGWGVLIERPGEEPIELCGGEENATNNRMELMAAIRALEETATDADVIIHADSQYVVKGITEWVSGWQRRGWLTAGGDPVKNADLWRRLIALSEDRRVTWRWVRGHSGDRGNERADALATLGRKRVSEFSDQ